MKFFVSVLTLASCVAVSSISLAAKPASAGKKAPTTPTQAATAAAAPAAPQKWDFEVKADDSVFAIVTHKSGIAAKLAHNHLIAARQFNSSISADPTKLNEGSFSFKAKVNELEFDRNDLQKKWFPTIQALDWLSEPFASLKDSDRETIRENALAADQLDGQKFPEIMARVESISDSSSKIGGKSFSKKAEVSVTIHGQTVKRSFAANLNLQGTELTAEAVADFKFSEFGIKPYKALMGALGNEDKFNMLVSFRAVKK
ncbi:MAG: YceI family protein [Silvanigrellaceae bacterium]